MSMSDTLGDMLTRIRNGQTANKSVIDAPASRFRANVLDVLKREGYIRNFSQVEKRPGINEFKIELKYYDGKPVISEIKNLRIPISQNHISCFFTNHNSRCIRITTH